MSISGNSIRSREFLLSVGFIFGLQLCLLLLTTPLYELDTNSYIRGMFSWSIYHNPFTNLFIGSLSRIWANVWFILAFQIGLFAFAAAFFLHSLRLPRRLLRLGILLAALEPVTTFYNFSLISDSSFTSFVLLFSGLLIRYLREPGWKGAVFFGAALGLAFLSRLSANIFLPLFGLILLLPGYAWKNKARDLGLAILPFALCYIFVLVGQSQINHGGLYTVKGRVLWDFSSSQYDPNELVAPEFEAFVNPYIFENGSLVGDRERRRELSYLGYKDCLLKYEGEGMGETEAILHCDGIWGEAAEQIRQKHFWEAEKEFLQDNLNDIHQKSYLEYRFTPGMHFYHPEEEYRYLDDLMKQNYGYSLAEHQGRIPRIWKDLGFTNIYAPIMYGLLLLAGLFGGILWLRNPKRWELLVPAVVIGIPLVFHLVYISYRLRFIAPYFVLGLGLVLLLVKLALEWKKAKISG